MAFHAHPAVEAACRFLHRLFLTVAQFHLIKGFDPFQRVALGRIDAVCLGSFLVGRGIGMGPETFPAQHLGAHHVGVVICQRLAVEIFVDRFCRPLAVAHGGDYRGRSQIDIAAGEDVRQIGLQGLGIDLQGIPAGHVQVHV